MKKLMFLLLLSCVCLIPFTAKSYYLIESCNTDGNCGISEGPEALPEEIPDNTSSIYTDQVLMFDDAMDIARDKSGSSNCSLATTNTIQCIKDNHAMIVKFKKIVVNTNETELDEELDELEEDIEE